jgi:hypothetical protein
MVIVLPHIIPTVIYIKYTVMTNFHQLGDSTNGAGVMLNFPLELQLC